MDLDVNLIVMLVIQYLCNFTPYVYMLNYLPYCTQNFTYAVVPLEKYVE